MRKISITNDLAKVTLANDDTRLNLDFHVWVGIFFLWAGGWCCDVDFMYDDDNYNKDNYEKKGRKTTPFETFNILPYVEFFHCVLKKRKRKIKKKIAHTGDTEFLNMCG